MPSSCSFFAPWFCQLMSHIYFHTQKRSNNVTEICSFRRLWSFCLFFCANDFFTVQIAKMLHLSILWGFFLPYPPFQASDIWQTKKWRWWVFRSMEELAIVWLEFQIDSPLSLLPPHFILFKLNICPNPRISSCSTSIDSATFGFSISHQCRNVALWRCHHHHFLCRYPPDIELIFPSLLFLFSFLKSNLSQSFSLCFNNCVIVCRSMGWKDENEDDYGLEIIFHSQRTEMRER